MIYLNDKTEGDYNADYIHWECSAPEVRSEMMQIPQRDGIINMTPMLSKEIHYGPRQIKIALELRAIRAEWPMYYSQLLRDLHGREVTVARSEDPNYFYIGTASVGQIDDHGSTAGVTISVQAQPFKRTEALIKEEAVQVAGSGVVTIENMYMRGYPIITASAAGMTVELNGEIFTLKQGKSEPYGLYFSEGENELTLTGTGTVQISWRGGIL